MIKREPKDVIDDALLEGVIKIITIGVDIKSCIKNAAIARQFDNVYTAIGFHPHESKDMGEKEFKQLEELVSNPKNVAIGEIGLDYYYNHSSPDIQRIVFQKQIDLANKYNLPIIIHDRDAHQDTRDILQERARGKKVILHCFSGNLKMASWCIEQDYYLGIGGVITFKKAQELCQIVHDIPLNNILLETDSPYLTPHPFRGKPNEPRYIPLIAEKIAQIKNITVREVGLITTENACRVFNLN